MYCRQANHCQQGMVFAVNPGDKMAQFQAAATGNTTRHCFFRKFSDLGSLGSLWCCHCHRYRHCIRWPGADDHLRDYGGYRIFNIYHDDRSQSYRRWNRWPLNLFACQHHAERRRYVTFEFHQKTTLSRLLASPLPARLCLVDSIRIVSLLWVS